MGPRAKSLAAAAGGAASRSKAKAKGQAKAKGHAKARGKAKAQGRTSGHAKAKSSPKASPKAKAKAWGRRPGPPPVLQPHDLSHPFHQDRCSRHPRVCSNRGWLQTTCAQLRRPVGVVSLENDGRGKSQVVLK